MEEHGRTKDPVIYRDARYMAKQELYRLRGLFPNMGTRELMHCLW